MERSVRTIIAAGTGGNTNRPLSKGTLNNFFLKFYLLSKSYINLLQLLNLFFKTDYYIDNLERKNGDENSFSTFNA